MKYKTILVCEQIKMFCLKNNIQNKIGYQSFEPSRKMTKHQQSLSWHGFATTSMQH